MTINVTLNSVASLQNTTTAQTTINGNNTTVTSAFADAFNTGGDQMQGNIDMNSNQIINLPAPGSANSPARLVDVISNPTLALTIPPTGTSGANVGFLNGNNTESGSVTFTKPITYTENSVPSTPASGFGVVYQDSTNHVLTSINASGTSSNTVVPKTATTNQFVTAVSAAGLVTQAQPSAANLSNGTTGTGAVVLAASPTFTGTTTLATVSAGATTCTTIAATSLAASGAITAASSGTTGTHASLNATATTAGGSTTPAITVGSANIGIYFGSGAPTITAPQGSLYIRSDGSSTATRMYINTTGSTTWTSVTTAA